MAGLKDLYWNIRDAVAKGMLIKSMKILNSDMHDSIVDGAILHDIPSKMVYVSSESELANFADMPVGTIAATYGFTAMYQLKPDGTWATVFEPAAE